MSVLSLEILCDVHYYDPSFTVLAAFVLGPTKLAEMARDFGKVAGELKDVPKEFREVVSFR